MSCCGCLELGFRLSVEGRCLGLDVMVLFLKVDVLE